jgi:hypothetical protein
MDGTSKDRLNTRGRRFRLASLDQALNEYPEFILSLTSKKQNYVRNFAVEGFIYYTIMNPFNGKISYMPNLDFEKCYKIAMMLVGNGIILSDQNLPKNSFKINATIAISGISSYGSVSNNRKMSHSDIIEKIKSYIKLEFSDRK